MPYKLPYKLRYICRKRPLRRLHLYSIAIPDIRHCKGPAYIFIRSLYIYSPSTISPRLFSNDRTSKLYAIPFLSLSLLDAVMSLKWGGWWGECVCNILGLSNAETKVFDVYFRELNVIIPSSFHIFYPSLLLFIFFYSGCCWVGWGIL
jgi:hypothetical protein